MKTGFANPPVDEEFARRSARYLASQGYRPGLIETTLVEQLGITDSFAHDISVIAA